MTDKTHDRPVITLNNNERYRYTSSKLMMITPRPPSVYFHAEEGVIMEITPDRYIKVRDEFTDNPEVIGLALLETVAHMNCYNN